MYVDPKETSKTCPKCGNAFRYNRKAQGWFKCIKCGYQSDADRGGDKTSQLECVYNVLVFKQNPPPLGGSSTQKIQAFYGLSWMPRCSFNAD
ncbi:zinc ribbon domain-containing protein [Koleobacter methoxysyntrophicus]|uniref:zinc ribbon domain-containing protein n=1 Tax=Koleobacter methoxysyntrophicus TaxID=2751313 RepID=UPI0019D5BC08